MSRQSVAAARGGALVLVLGGTAEARELATALVAEGRSVLTSLAGRVADPARPAGAVRIGGFGGPAGLARFLREHGIGAVLDATHPFATTISASAAEAAAATGVPLLRLQRPGWAGHPGAAGWTWVADLDAAREAAGPARRPVLTTGRQSLAAFLPWSDREVLARVVDPPGLVLPARWRLVRSRGPYSYDAERALLEQHQADALLTKDSGGSHVAAKLDAAADLGVPLVVVRRPPAPAGVARVGSVADARNWLAGLGQPGSPDRTDRV